MKTQKLSLETDLYKGQKVEVRKIHKQRGGETYAVCRPWSKYGALETLDDLAQANAVARFIDDHGGLFDTATREKAHRYAGILA